MSLTRSVFVLGVLLLIVQGSSAFAQTLAWSQARDGGFGASATWPGHLAVDGDGSVYALGWAVNGTNVGLLVKYTSLGYEVWTRIERDGQPWGLAVDRRGWPLVLTPYRTVAYDGAGNVRWRADHAFDQRYLEGHVIASAPDGGAYVGGISTPAGGGPVELGLMRLDQDGRVAWLRTLRAPEGEVRYVSALELDHAGRMYVAGQGGKVDEPNAATSFVAAFAPDGSPLWSRWFAGMQATDAPVLAVDASGGAYLSLPGGALFDFRTVELGAGGETVGSFDTIATLTGFGKPARATVSANGTLCLAGATSAQAIVACHDASGAQRWADVRPWAAFTGLGFDPSGRLLALWTGPGPRPVAAAFEPSGAVAWVRDQWGDPVDKGAWAARLLITNSGRILVGALGQGTSVPTAFTMGLEPSGFVDFVASPYGIPPADWAWSSRLDANGNALVMAAGFDAGFRDRLLKYDASGALQWVREPLGGPETGEGVWAFDVGPGGESVVVGLAGAPIGRPRVVRLDAAGSTSWTKDDILPPEWDQGAATAVAVDALGAAYVAGWAWDTDTNQSRFFLCKYGAGGQLLWRRFDGWTTAYVGWQVLLTRVGSDRVALGGTVWNPAAQASPFRLWVVDSTGNDVWTAMPTDAAGFIDALAADSTGAVVAGTTYPGRVYKFGAAGDLEWTRSSAESIEWDVNALMVDANRDVVVAYGADSCLLQRLTPAGDLLWQERIDYPEGASYCAAFAPRPTGGFFVSGGYIDGFDQGQHGFLSACDAAGRVDWSRNTGAPGAAGASALNALAADSSGRILVAGYVFGGATDYDALVQVVTDDARVAQAFYTVPPCRIVDTRDPALGGPSPLAAGSQTDLAIAGMCGVPLTARAVALNITAVTPSSPGHVTAFPAGRVAPRASVLSHGAGATRASQATLGLGDGGQLTLRNVQVTGALHLLVDVAGYFE